MSLQVGVKWSAAISCISEIRNSEIKNYEHFQSTFLEHLVYATLNQSMCADRSTNTKINRKQMSKEGAREISCLLCVFLI